MKVNVSQETDTELLLFITEFRFLKTRTCNINIFFYLPMWHHMVLRLVSTNQTDYFMH